MKPKRPPKLQFHKHSQRYFVELNSKRFYLGRNRTEAEARYHTLIGEWMNNGCRLRVPQDEITVVEVAAQFLEWAEGYYRREDGTPTGQLPRVKAAMKGLHECYGKTLAVEFGPMKLRVVRDAWIKKGLARTNINSLVGVVKQCFKWAASREMVPVVVWQGLTTLDGLRAGRSEAREPEPVKPVPEGHIEAVKPYVSRQVWALIQLQLLTGARPGELLGLRATDIDRSGEIWEARLQHHKVSYRGKERILLFGPRAQEVLRPFIVARPVGSYLFSPRDAEADRHAKAPTHRRPNQRPNLKKSGRKVGEYYTPASYSRAIARACKKADVPHWFPYQLRHNAATLFRQRSGLEVAQIMLGHARADVTQVYAEINLEKAREVAGKMC